MSEADWTIETLAALGLRPPRGDEELIEVIQLDTFESWAAQLRIAVSERRHADVEAIASLRQPSHLALFHVTRGRYRSSSIDDRGGVAVEETEEARRTELVPLAQAASVVGCKPLSRFPKPDSWRGRRLRRRLLREPYEFEGSSLFWIDDLELLQLLERLGGDTSDQGWMGIPLLVRMAEKGAHEVVRFLVEERGHDPNKKRQDGGYTALHWAAKLETVRYLMARGADACSLTTWGDSVLAQQLGRDRNRSR